MSNISRAAWSAPTTPEEAARRAGGRRHYNHQRSWQTFHRRLEVMRLLRQKGGLTVRGYQARIAAELGVSRATVCRDVQALLREGWPCPQCGAYHRPADPELEEPD